MHIDVNNAFLSWTAVDLLKNGYPIDVRNIESIIGGDESQRRGIVLAKSNVAKSKGVKTAETIRDAKRKCNDLKIYPPNYKLYQENTFFFPLSYLDIISNILSFCALLLSLISVLLHLTVCPKEIPCP